MTYSINVIYLPFPEDQKEKKNSLLFQILLWYTLCKAINMPNYVIEFPNTKVPKRFHFGELKQINMLMITIHEF